MNITARRISGSTFSAEDKLEVTFTSDNQPMSSVVHTIELVSGINVTHGGGGLVGEYLHYKAVERDADADGIIDYSDIEMALVQESQGTSVIKVVCEAVTKADADAFIVEMEAYLEREQVALGLEEEFTEVAPTVTPTVLKTGEITLEWTTDTFV
jgi:hypothetical protein